MEGESAVARAGELRTIESRELPDLCRAGFAGLVAVAAIQGAERARAHVHKAARLGGRRVCTIVGSETMRWSPGISIAHVLRVLDPSSPDEIPRNRRSLPALVDALVEAIVAWNHRANSPTMIVVEQAQYLDATARLTIEHAAKRIEHLDVVIALVGEQASAVPSADDEPGTSSARLAAARLREAGNHLDAVTELRRSIRQSIADGWVVEALHDCDTALALGATHVHHLELLRINAELATEIEHPRAVDRWLRYAREAERVGGDEQLSYGWFQLYWADQDGKHLHRLERAALFEDASGWADRARACMACLRGDYREAIEHDTRALEAARTTGDWRLEQMALEKLALAGMTIGEMDDAIELLQQSLEMAEQHHRYSSLVPGWLSLSDLYADELLPNQQLDAARTAGRWATEAGLLNWIDVCQVYEAYALANLGRLHQARELAGFANRRSQHQEPSYRLTALVRQVSHILLEVGDAAAAARCLARLESLAEQAGVATFDIEVAFDRARLAALRGDLDLASHLAGTVDRTEPAVTAQVALWMGRVAMWSDHAGAWTTAQSLAAALPTGTTLDLALREFEAIDLARAGDVEPLLSIAQEWRDRGRLLDSARALTTAGFLSLRETGSTVLLDEAYGELTRCGANGDADLVRQVLGRSGRRVDARDSSKRFTDREIDVARMVAHGMGTAEIAEGLKVSHSNVHRLISSLYRKTGANTRSGLATWVFDTRTPTGGAA